jgi:PKD repeat protein
MRRAFSVASWILGAALGLGCQAAKNQPPEAKLVGPETIRVDAPATFDASGSIDTGGLLTAWYFDFGDGTFTSGETPVETHVYRKPGKLTVTLTVHDNAGAEHSVSREVIVTANQPPVPSLAGPDSARVNIAVAFDATGSSDPDGEVAAYAWDLDLDGSYDDASGAEVTWTFRTPGTQTIGLQVLDQDGASATALKEITIDDNLAPLAAFTGPTQLVALQTGSFEAAASDPDGSIEAFEWDLGYDHISFDPERSGTSINASFESAGKIWVALRVTDDEGKEAIAATEVEVLSLAQASPAPVAKFTGPATARELEPAGFDSSDSQAEGGQIALREWDFDYQDGEFEAMATGLAVTYAFPGPGQAVVALRITAQYKDGSSVQATVTQALAVLANQAPSAVFTAPATAEVDIPVTFDASNSKDADGSLVAWEWDFSYNGVAFMPEQTGVVATHAFSQAGSTVVALRVTDQSGAQAISTRALVVLANQPPLADLTGPTTATVGEAIVLSAAASKDPDGVIKTYRWDFEGDGIEDTTGTAATATHTYQSADAGARQAKLTVVDDDGTQASATWKVLVKTVAEASLPPVASFTAPSQVREDEPAGFDASASKATQGTLTLYEWDLAYTAPEGFSADLEGIAVTHAYPDPGSFLVALRITVMYADGSQATVIASRSLEVTANQVPIAKVAGQTKAIVGDPVTFDGSGSTDDDGSVMAWEWDFEYGGDPKDFDADASGIAATHTFDAPGTYVVALRVTDSDGGQTITTVAIEISGNQPPIAKLVGPTAAVSGVLASFDGSGSSDADGTIVKVEWDFTYDLTTLVSEASTAKASRTYTNAEAGTATVALRVTDDKGATGLATQEITIKTQATSNPPPQASFSSAASVREDKPAGFDGSASTAEGGTITLREWDLDYDGTSFAEPSDATGISVSHTYAQAGTYLVGHRVTASYPDGSTAQALATRTIVVTPNLPPNPVLAGAQSGKVGVPIAFDAGGSTDTDGTIQSYDFDFSYNPSDGFVTEASGVGTSHSFAQSGTFVVALRATDNDGATAIATQTVEIAANATPVAAFASPSSGLVGQLIGFDGTGSSDSDGSLTKHEWDFDYDGTTFTSDSSGMVVNRAFMAAKTYTVALRVTDDLGAQAIATRQVLIQTVADGNPPPTASLVGPSTLRVNELGSFDGSGSSAQAGAITSYEWDFEYAGSFTQEATGAVQSRAYGTAGTYVVALRVTATYADQSTKQSTATRSVQVTPNQLPIADFTAPASVRINQAAGLDAGLSQDPDGTIATYQWDFDYDGTTFTTPVDASGVLAQKSYPTAGTRTIALRVTDSDGAQNLKTRSLTVTPNQPPIASFTAPGSIRINQTAGFDGSASSDPDGTLTAYAWDFDYNGTFPGVPDATTAVASTTYATAGTRVLALRVTDSDGAQTLTTRTLEVTPNQPPVASFTAPLSARVGQTVSLDGTGSTDADGTITAYVWDLDYTGSLGVDATTSVVTTSYASAGQRVVALRVTDSDNAPSAIVTRTIQVVANTPPTAQIMGPSTADLGTPTSFDGSSSSDPDGTVGTWEWDMDYDGTTFNVDSTSKAPSFTFTAAKTYLVALRVTDNEGAQNTATHSVAASEQNQLSVTGVAPASGPRFGGTKLTLTGTAFTSGGGTTVLVGGSFATGVVVVNSTTLTAVTPAGLPGAAAIQVINANGDVTLPGGNGGFSYTGASNPAAGPFCWEDVSGTGTQVLAGGTDDANAPVSLPFDFGYFGVVYPAGSSLRVCSNGWMSPTDTSSAFSDSAIPSLSNPLNMIAPFFFDQAILPGGTVAWQVLGAVPNRRLIVEWDGATEAPGQTDDYTYQAVLYEGSYNIKFQYLNTPEYSPPDFTNDRPAGGQATIGVQGASGGQGTGFASNLGQRGLAPGGRTIVFTPNAAGTAYAFTTDLTLTVVGTTLTDAAVGQGASFDIQLSRAVDPATLIASDPPLATDTVQVYLTADPNKRAAITPTLSVDKQTLTVTLSSPLAGSSNYTVSVGALATPEGSLHSADPIAGSACSGGLPVTPYTNTFVSQFMVVQDLAVDGLPQGVVYNPTTQRVHVSTYGNDRIYTYDANTRAEVHRYDFENNSFTPGRMAVAPGANRLYVPNYNDQSVRVFNVASVPITVVTTTSIGKPVWSAVVSANGNRAYLTLPDDDLISAISLPGNGVCKVGALVLPSVDPPGSEPDMLAIAWDPGNANRYFAANDRYVHRINRSTNCGTADTVAQSFDIGDSSSFWDIAVRHDPAQAPATKIYVSEYETSSNDRRITVLRLNGGGSIEFHASVTNLDRVAGLELNSAGLLAFSFDKGDQFGLLDTTTDTILSTVHVPNCNAGGNYWDGMDLAVATLATGDEYWISCPNDTRVQVVR